MSNLMVATERQLFNELEASIQADHLSGNRAGLAETYAKGATLYDGQGEVDAACFFWTQAYILALDAGADGLAEAMYDELDAHGRMG
jgi:hypothetical protein